MTKNRWVRIHWRAYRVRTLRRRARRLDDWEAAVSPWTFWGLHR